MKKAIKVVLLFLVMILPVFVSAGTYDTEVNKANNLLNKDNYVNTYEKYLLYGSNLKFEYSNNNNVVNTSFTRGGFISLDEYNLTTRKGTSYLFDGVEYWTLSKNGNNVYAITYDNINTAKNKNVSYNGRVTEFVNPGVTVHGEGKLNNPWTFDAIYKVKVKVDNRYATIESGNNQYVKGGCTSNECTAKIKIVEKTGYRYIANDCDGLYDDTTKTLSVNNVSRDTTCNVTFGKGIYVVTLNQGTPNKIYLKYGENYYKEYQMKNIIRSIENVTPKSGYTFMGYFYNGNKIINGDKETNTDDNRKILYSSVTSKYITKDVTLDPTWGANEYTVSYDCNGGTVPPTTQVIVYDNKFTITSSVCQRGGYIQTGWNTKADGTGESWTTSNKTDVTWKIANNVKLYAVWSECPAGTYSPESSNECTACPAGKVCPNRRRCTGCPVEPIDIPESCPTGYTSDTNSKMISNCYINVEAGYYLGTANGTSKTVCANGYYKEAHKVNYGKTSTCSACPNGYKDGTALANKTAQDKCLRNVAAGYRVASAKATTNTECGKGEYKTAHSVTYGSTSTCSACPDGYKDGTAVANKTAQNTCLRNVAAGYRVASANATTNTECGKGEYKTAHSVTYGSTSSCSACPDGYKDGSAVANKTAQDKCLKSVAAGYKVASAKGAATACDNGYYKTAHSVTYGSTSTCTQCPSGYRNGTAVANKTAESTCLKSVAAGYKVASAKGAETKCAAGTYKEAHNVTYGGTSSCSNCSSDQWSNEGAGTCFSKCNSITYKDGTTCTKKCGSGTYNRIAYSAYDSSYRCPSSDTTSGGSACNTQACCSKTSTSYGSWSGWGACSKACGTGTQTRTRSYTVTSDYDGSVCSTGTDTGSQNCNTQTCCSSTTTTWNAWGGWGTCSKKCGTGTQSRTRTGTKYSTYDGSNCGSDSQSESQNCNTQTCCSSTSTTWNAWGGWSKCSASCGGGTQSRSRTGTKYSTYDGSNCGSDSQSESQSCETQGCCSSTYPSYGEWSGWSACSKTLCGKGTQTRSRTITYYSSYNHQYCSSKSESGSQTCDTGVDCCSKTTNVPRTDWTGCSKSCGGGEKSRVIGYRSAIDSSVGCGSGTEYQSCNEQSCCSSYSTSCGGCSWGACSKTCGGGTQYGSKTCYKTSRYDSSSCGSYSSSCGSRSCNTRACTGGGCFLAGTKVKTILGYKDIDKVNKGDLVLTYNETTGKNEYKEVLERLVHLDTRERLYTLSIEGKTLQVTENHRFYIKNSNGENWISAKELKVGDYVRYSDGTYHKINYITYSVQTNTVYNLTIKDNHNYYVGEEEILVHNQKVNSGGCFVAGTKVRTMYGYKDIDKIEEGDYVLSYNEYGKINQWKKVTYKFVFDNMKENLYTLTFDDQTKLELTHKHKVFILKGNTFDYVAAEDLKVGDVVRNSLGKEHKITNIEYRPINETVYNLEVFDNHNFYVSENDILVHNARRVFGGVNIIK